MNEKKFNYRLGRLTVKTSMSAPETMAKETATTHALILILGSFRYSCAAGFYLDADGLTCHDINECQANNGKCSQKCINTQGDHSCFCFEGFVSLVRILFFFTCLFLFLPGYLWHSMTSANPSHTEFISDAQNANCFFFGGGGAFFCFFRCERRGLVSNLTAQVKHGVPLSLSLSSLFSCSYFLFACHRWVFWWDKPVWQSRELPQHSW